MKKIDLGQAIGILANVGVIGGLIFVGFQLRQDRVIATMDSVAAISDQRLTSFQLQIESSDVWVRGLADDPLSVEEMAIFDALAAAHMQFYFGSYFRNVQVGTTENRNRWAREAAFDIVTNPGLSAWWQRKSERDANVGSAGGWESAVNNEISRFKAEDE